MEQLLWHHDPPRSLHSPILVTAWDGWFDVGGAATGAVEAMRGPDATHLASIDSDEFFDFNEHRPNLRIGPDGRRIIEWPSNDVHCLTLDNRDRDLVFIEGVEPHLRWRTFVDAVIEVIERLDVKLVVTLGSMIAEVPHTRPPTITGSTTDMELGKRLRLNLPSYQGPTGIVGALHQRLDAADIPVHRSSDVAYKGTINDPRINQVRILRPQEIPRYVADGLFDLGITGRDWVAETGSDVVSLGKLQYSKNTSRPIRMVLAVPGDSLWESPEDLPQGVKISSEYPALTKQFFDELGIEADIALSYGATEAKAPDIVDAVVEITETGRALRAAGLKIIHTILTSYTELVANPTSYADPEQRHAMEQIHTLLGGVLEARGKVLVKMNVPAASLDKVIDLLPSMKAPTVNELFGGHGYAVETVVPKIDINVLIPELRDAGASDIIELPLAKIVH